LLRREGIRCRLRPARHADKLVERHRAHSEQMVRCPSTTALIPCASWPAAVVVHPPATLLIECVARWRAATESDRQLAPTGFVDGDPMSPHGADASQELATPGVIEEGRWAAGFDRRVGAIAPGTHADGIAARSSRGGRHGGMLTHSRKAPKENPGVAELLRDRLRDGELVPGESVRHGARQGPERAGGRHPALPGAAARGIRLLRPVQTHRPPPERRTEQRARTTLACFPVSSNLMAAKFER
jgi:hypothetical protein